MKVSQLVDLARPRHWIKNAIVLLPVFFARQAAEPRAWGQTLLTAVAFCLASSAIYAINDVRDAPQDRLHPKKKHRPVASGSVSPAAAIALAGVLVVAALGISAGANLAVPGIVVGYVLLQVAYSFILKERMLLDVMAIAGGFVLRAVAGAVAIRADVSPWLVICAFTLCMFMGFCKRRNESAAFAESAEANAHRRTLAGYTPELLTHLITLSAAIAILTYLFYAASPRTQAHFGTVYLIYTVPIVIYAIARFAMLSMMGRFDGPTDLVLRDRPIELAAGLWIAAVVAVIYWGPDLQAWLNANY